MPVCHESKRITDPKWENLDFTTEEKFLIQMKKIDVDTLVDRDENGEDNFESGLERALIEAKESLSPQQKTVLSLKQVLDSGDQLKTALRQIVKSSVREKKSFEQAFLDSNMSDWARKTLMAFRNAGVQLSERDVTMDIIEHTERNMEEIKEAMARVTWATGDHTVNIDLNLETKNKKKNTVDAKQTQTALKRGINLFRSLFGRKHNIDAFLSGGDMMVNGERFDYLINSKGNLLKRTALCNGVHIPYNLTVLNKTGVVLGEGCTTFDNTPVIDQIIALMLHIQENEDEILDNMNISQRSDAFYDDPYFSDKFKRPDGIISFVMDDMSTELMTTDEEIVNTTAGSVTTCCFNIDMNKEEKIKQEMKRLQPRAVRFLAGKLGLTETSITKLLNSGYHTDEVLDTVSLCYRMDGVSEARDYMRSLDGIRQALPVS